MKKLSLVVPAYNEAANLPQVVAGLCDEFSRVEPSFELIVVDNGSDDDTPRVLEGLVGSHPNLRTVRLYPNRGYGSGILAGLKSAEGEFLGWVHADLQVVPADVARIYRACASSDAPLSLAKAVRITRDEPRWRVVQSAAYNTLFRLIFRTGCRDINGTPKIFTRALYERSGLTAADWFIDPEIMIGALRLGARISEVEIAWQERRGRSKVHFLTALEFARNLMHSAFRRR